MKDLEKSNTKLIPLQKHVFQEEALQKSLRKEKKLKNILFVSIIISLILGYVAGSILPSQGLNQLRNRLQEGQVISDNKINAVLDIMKKNWFFGKDISNLSSRLEDQALKGITSNKEDDHTEYMTKEEVVAFNNQLKRQYVGIGIQYLKSNEKILVQKVFRNSPAEKAGVQVGDLISKVNGTSLEGKTVNETRDLVRGKEGTKIVLEVQRGSKIISLQVTRGPVLASTYGKIINDTTAYLELFQFGESTHVELKPYLDEFEKKGVTKLIVDLRDNGGGYLTTLKDIASYFLSSKTTVMEQVYSDGSREVIRTSGKPYENFKQIVLLVNENTASASEVLTLALKEQRKDVTVIGTKTYGKGTVQVSRAFRDGSAIKYTTSKWVSPKGEWINKKGIEPDIKTDVPEVLRTAQPNLKEGDVLKVDSVSPVTKYAQEALAYLGYQPGRRDGYFSEQMRKAILKFQEKEGLETTGAINRKTYNAIVSRMVYVYNTDKSKDKAYQKALEVLHG
ncbi:MULTISPECIES: S41 family peptidase [Terrabacteria group]|uniref:S41 family peptidase n=1 Tax=Bacillati TaxID=1783272 RepID=UPI001C6F2513|nr:MULTISPECIES: S41 family peptidase [Terrabacteria group]MBW9212662.1 S41 family peptidase [Trueperella sp. zg.1013]